MLLWCLCFYLSTTAYVLMTWPRITDMLSDIGAFMLKHKNAVDEDEDGDEAINKKNREEIISNMRKIANAHGYSNTQFIIVLILVIINKPFIMLFYK